MSSQINDGKADHLFTIETASSVALDAQRSARVDFAITYLGSGSPPDVKARLVVAPERGWLESLIFWRRKAERLMAEPSWLYLPDLRLSDSLLKSGKTTTLTVLINVPTDVPPGDYNFRLALVDKRERTLARSQLIIIQLKNQHFDIKMTAPGMQRFSLGLNRKKDCHFQVFNISGEKMQGRARLTPHPAETPISRFGPPERDLDVGWLSFDEPSEQNYPYPDDEGQSYNVHLEVPREAPPGVYHFSLDVANAENPDEYFAPGPVVTFSVPAIPWKLVTILVVLMVLAVGIWVLRRPSIKVAASAPVQIPYNGNAVTGITNITSTIPISITAGTQFSYTLTITNTAGLLGRWPATSRDVGDLVDTLGSGATFVQDGIKGCTITDEARTSITCRLPDGESILQGETYSYTLTAQIASTQTAPVTHTLSLGKTLPITYKVDVGRKSNLVLEWLASPEAGNQDDTLVYKFQVVNAGPSQSDPVALAFEPSGPPGVDASSFLTITGKTDACQTSQLEACDCEVSNLVKCQLDELAPKASKAVTITLIPGPSVSGEISNTVTLSETVPVMIETKKLAVNPIHGLKVNLSAGEPNIPIQPGQLMTYTITVTNTMPFPAHNIQVDFLQPDQFRGQVALSDINPKNTCWINIKPSKDNNKPEYRVHCVIDRLQVGEPQTITVKTQPEDVGIYDGSVSVESRGFKSSDTVSTNVTREQELALRLPGRSPDGNQPLSPLTVVLNDKVHDNLKKDSGQRCAFITTRIPKGAYWGLVARKPVLVGAPAGASAY